MEQKSEKGVLLFSGGLDSTTLLYHLMDIGVDVYPLLFRYKQRHQVQELSRARKIVRSLKLKYHTICFCTFFEEKKNPLMNRELELEHNRLEEIGSHISSTYVPMRNTLFLSFGVAYAENIGAKKVYIAANQVDFSGYPDCRKGFFDRYNDMLEELGMDIRVEAPFVDMTKKEIIRRGLDLGVPYEKTWSCYRGEERPCLVCDACQLRAKGFRENNTKDPLLTDEEWKKQISILDGE